jgi:hypothetical protein
MNCNFPVSLVQTSAFLVCLPEGWREMFQFQLSNFPTSTLSKLPFIAHLMKQRYRKQNVFVKVFWLFKYTMY